MAPPRGVTFPIPVDYTQVGPSLARITELGMLMDYASQLPHCTWHLSPQSLHVFTCKPWQIHAQSACP